MKLLLSILIATLIYGTGVYYFTHQSDSVGVAPRVLTTRQGGTATSTAQPGFVLYGNTDGTWTQVSSTTLSAGGVTQYWSYNSGTDVLSPNISESSNTSILTISSLQATSTTATSTFANGVAIGGNFTVGTTTLESDHVFHVVDTTDVANKVLAHFKWDSATPAAGDRLDVLFTMSNAAGNETEYARIDSVIRSTSTGAENGSLTFDVIRNGTLEQAAVFDNDEIIMNDAQSDRNFIVKDSSGTAFTIKGNTGFVGFGTTSPGAVIDVKGTSGDQIMTLFSDAGTKLFELLNSGVATLLGVWDFSGADSLALPAASNPTVDAAGEIAVNTSTSSLRYYDGTAERQIKYEWAWGQNFASTTLGYDGGYGSAGTTTVKRAGFKYQNTITEIYCKTDQGTAKLEIGNGNSTSTVATCSTSGVSVTPSLTTAARNDLLVNIGTQSSDPNFIYLDVTSAWTTD